MVGILLLCRGYNDSHLLTFFRTGRFEWDGVNFTESAQNVSFSIEGGGAVPVLRAELRNAEGNYQGADVNLSERLENENGNIVFI